MEPPLNITPAQSPLVIIPTIDSPLPPIKNPNIVNMQLQLQLPPPPPPPPPANKSPNKQKKTAFHDNNESIDMDLSDDESPPMIEENKNHIFKPNMSEQAILPPPPIPQNLCDFTKDDTGKDDMEPILVPNLEPMSPIIPMEPLNWNEEWFNGRPPPQEMMRFPPPNKRPHEFRGGFRGRGHNDHGEIFRGRGRGRGFRGMRGMNNWVPNRGFARGHRGFRGQFRGGF